MTDSTLTLPDMTDTEVTVVLAGVSSIQMQALAAGDISKVEAAGNTLSKLAKENPTAVREAFLRNSDAFRVAQMPDDLLDHLDLEERDGQLYRPDGDDGWTQVEVE